MRENLSQRTDDELMSLFGGGSNEAFETLVLRYKNALYQYIKSMVLDQGAAEDLFQEVFITLFKSADKYQAQGKFKAWLFLMARNKVLNYFRAQNKNTTSLDQTDEEGNAFLQDTLPDTSAPVLEGLTQRETAQAVHRALEQLPERQREILILRQDMSFKEIAEMLGRPLGTILADSYRALGKLKQLLTAQPGPEETL